MSQGKLRVRKFVEQTFGENAYVVSAPHEKGYDVGWVIDPSFPPQPEDILEYAKAEGITIEMIVLTHGHADHIAGIDAVHAGCPEAAVAIHPNDLPMLSDANLNLSAPFGMELIAQTEATAALRPGEDLALGTKNFRILDTSGHSPGGISLYCEAAGIVITGDALFAGSIGRTDFPGSNHVQLLSNLRTNLLALPDDTVVYSGHGPSTTIGAERKSNPFLVE